MSLKMLCATENRRFSTSGLCQLQQSGADVVNRERCCSELVEHIPDLFRFGVGPGSELLPCHRRQRKQRMHASIRLLVMGKPSTQELS